MSNFTNPASPRGTCDIQVIIDMSGSMLIHTLETLSSLYEFVKQQQSLDPNALLSVCLFNNTVSTPLKDVKISEIDSLDVLMERLNYKPMGMTALYDAIGESVSQKLSSNRKDNVTVVILTDGADNSSIKYTKKKISKMIKDAKKKHNWEVYFIGKDIDSFGEGQGLSVGKGNCFSVDKRTSISDVMRTVSRTAYFSRSASCIMKDDKDD